MTTPAEALAAIEQLERLGVAVPPSVSMAAGIAASGATAAPAALTAQARAAAITMRTLLAAVGPNSEGAVNQRTRFVFRPGTPDASLVPGLYNDFTALMADLVESPGPKTLFMDGSLAALSIPAGVWDLTDTVLSGRIAQRFLQPSVDLEDGAIIDGLAAVDTLDLVGNATSTPHFTATTVGASVQYTLYLNGARINNNGSVAVFSAGTAFLELIMTAFTTFFPGTNSLETSGPSGVVVVPLQASFVGDDSVVGDGLFIARYAQASGTVSLSHAGFTGTILEQKFGNPVGVGMSGLTPGNWVAPAPADLLDAVERLATTVAILNAGPIP